MNIEIKELENIRDSLEEKYDVLEREIDRLYSLNKVTEAGNKEKLQNLINLQLNYLDCIIKNLLETPRLYEKFKKLNKEYEELVGE